MRWWGRFLPLVMLTRAVILNPVSAQSKPSPGKHETTAALPPSSVNQNNQSALYVALVEALHAITEQEKTIAQQTRAQNESLISPSHVQEGLLFVGFLYSFVAWMQLRSMRESLQVTQRAYVNVNRIEMLAPETSDELRFYRTAFVIRNSGRTPTRNLLIQVHGEISKEPFGQGVPTDIDKIPRAPFFGMGLPPDTEHRVRYDFPSAHLKADDVRRGNLYANCWATISYKDQFGGSHASIEPFHYDPIAQNFDRHIMGFKESSRRYRQDNGYQRKARAWYRSLKKRLN